MIIAFTGKGGSGKSTLSTRFISFLLEKGKKVLAIDADHNMDLSYNLAPAEADMRYVGDSLQELRSYCSLGAEEHYSAALLSNMPPKFRLSPPDAYTATFSSQVSEKLRLMACGPHTEKVLNGQSCSHALGTALKVYLPLLKLESDEAVVMDEKAGADGVGTGIITGCDLVVICAEPTPHSCKAARQIGKLLDFYGVPYECVLNKVRHDAGTEDILSLLPKPPLGTVPFCSEPLSVPRVRAEKEAFTLVMERAGEYAAVPETRFIRSRQKFINNLSYKQT